mmetsp:Transcript_31382/g.101432  ORF Transcript_31382/g.101432 Transcript_31382/m.101432 type:complete len:228 (+) Transcript_31382:672-1355(+)
MEPGRSIAGHNAVVLRGGTCDGHQRARRSAVWMYATGAIALPSPPLSPAWPARRPHSIWPPNSRTLSSASLIRLLLAPPPLPPVPIRRVRRAPTEPQNLKRHHDTRRWMRPVPPHGPNRPDGALSSSSSSKNPRPRVGRVLRMATPCRLPPRAPRSPHPRRRRSQRRQRPCRCYCWPPARRPHPSLRPRQSAVPGSLPAAMPACRSAGIRKASLRRSRWRACRRARS